MKIETIVLFIVNPSFWGTLIGGVLIIMQIRAFYLKKKMQK